MLSLSRTKTLCSAILGVSTALFLNACSISDSVGSISDSSGSFAKSSESISDSSTSSSKSDDKAAMLTTTVMGMKSRILR